MLQLEAIVEQEMAEMGHAHITWVYTDAFLINY